MSTVAKTVHYQPETIRILHVEDDTGFADLVATFLAREDGQFDVETAHTASDGLERLAEADVDCVVSDYDMPGQSGIDLLDAVRDEYPDLPFILFTGKGSEEVASDAISAGATDYLQKQGGTNQYELLANRVRNAVEQYRATQEVRTTHRRLQELAESSTDCLWMFTRDWDELLFISGYETVWNRPTEAIEQNPQDFLNAIDPEDRDFVERELDQLSAGESVDIEFKIQRGEDEPGWVWVKGHPIFDDDGNVVRVVGFTRDVTDRKEREQEMERYLDLFEQAQEIASFGAWEYDIEAEEGWWTDEVYRIHAVSTDADRAPERSFQQYHPEDQPVIRTAFQSAIEEGKPYDLEVRFVDTDGTHKWVHTQGDPQPADDPVRVRGTIQDITERKERERELQELTDRYETIFNHSHDAIFLLDVEAGPTFRIAELNERDEELIGRSASDVIGSTLYDFYDGETADRAVEAYRRCLEAGESITDTAEYELDGTTRTFETTLRPVRAEGEIVQIVGVSREVTEQRQRERELEATNAVLSTLFEALPVGVLAEDASRSVLAINERMFELFGLPGSPDDVIGTDCENLTDRLSDTVVDPDGFVKRIDEVVTTQTRVSDEAFPLQDGRTFQRSYEPVELPDCEGHLWLYRDVTPSKEREQRLQETTSRLEALFDNSPDMIDILDTAGRLRNVNDRFCEEFGYDENEVIGRPIWEIDKLVDADDVNCFLSDFSLDERRKIEGVYERRDGSTFPVEVHLLRLDIEGEDRFLAISRDITERKRREQELTQQNERLEEFASIVSHHLRNPLNVIEGRVELAKTECESDHLDHIARAQERMNALIGDLLTLAREGEQVGEMESVDLGTLTENCWRTIATADATLSIDVERVIRADKSRLQQLLENLMRNAVEHGGEDVAISVGELEDGFYLEDDGQGIPEAERDNKFDAGNSTAEDGTGFGLSIVKQVAQAHGWEVRIADGSEGGARFEITGVEYTPE